MLTRSKGQEPLLEDVVGKLRPAPLRSERRLKPGREARHVLEPCRGGVRRRRGARGGAPGPSGTPGARATDATDVAREVDREGKGGGRREAQQGLEGPHPPARQP